MKKTIVFLYTELADYIKVCLDRLAESGVDVHVFHYPVNPEAPFEFDFESSPCKFYLRTSYTRNRLRDEVLKINPSAIICSGWVDRDYVSICREIKPTINTVVAIDNQIEPGLKPFISRLRARILFKSAFRNAWVPGAPQVAYAKNIGFKPAQIKTGFYTIDVKKWNIKTANQEGENFPKRFVFVGRYLKFKGIFELWEAYKQMNAKGWELFCAGGGDLYPQRVIAEGIYHLGFVQPADLGRFVAEGGVFVLPSRKEPWGMVLHEFAAAGFPIICTNKVGAASAFVNHGENGFVVNPNQIDELKNALEKIIALSPKELKKMGQKSKELAAKVHVEGWLSTALYFMDS